MVRVGLVGFGKVGQFLLNEFVSQPDTFEVVFVWNRTGNTLLENTFIKEHPECMLDSLDSIEKLGREIDIIIEVSHPTIVVQYAKLFLKVADLFVGSPSAFSTKDLDECIQAVQTGKFRNNIYVPVGALWGSRDISRLAAMNKLSALNITMKKHPNSYRLEEGEAKTILDRVIKEGTEGETVLFKGPVREICKHAPNNVNTMACLALASGPNLGFDTVMGCIISDPNLESHVIEIEVIGQNGFKVQTIRDNPATVGAVTGRATFDSFWGSIMEACEIFEVSRQNKHRIGKIVIV